MILHRELEARPECGATTTPSAATLLADEWAQALRLQHSLSLFVVALDHPRRFILQHGRAEAEAHLLRLGVTLSVNAMRARDRVERCSADAFMVLLPNTPVDGARTVAERCLKAIRAAHAEHPLTVSLGIGTLIPRSEALHSAFFNAVAQLCDQAAGAGGDRLMARHFGRLRAGDVWE